MNQNVIMSKKMLNRAIKELLWCDPEMVFPKVIEFCEKMGEPIFKFTIEKIETDIFVDEKGQKWKKIIE